MEEGFGAPDDEVDDVARTVFGSAAMVISLPIASTVSAVNLYANREDPVGAFVGVAKLSARVGAAIGSRVAK